MKLLIVALCLVAAVCADDWKLQTRDDLLKYRGECVEELSVPADLVENYKKWNFPEDEKTKCYIRCIFTKMGLFADNDGFNIDHLVQQLGQGRNPEEIRAEIIKCAEAPNGNKDNACEWAYRGFKCFQDAHLELIKMSVKKD